MDGLRTLEQPSHRALLRRVNHARRPSRSTIDDDSRRAPALHPLIESAALRRANSIF